MWFRACSNAMGIFAGQCVSGLKGSSETTVAGRLGVSFGGNHKHEQCKWLRGSCRYSVILTIFDFDGITGLNGKCVERFVERRLEFLEAQPYEGRTGFSQDKRGLPPKYDALLCPASNFLAPTYASAQLEK